MIIKSNRTMAYEKFMFLDNGQLFSIDNLYGDTIKRYFIKIKGITVPNQPGSAFTGCGYAVNLENGDFVAIKLDKKVILETGSITLED